MPNMGSIVSVIVAGPLQKNPTPRRTKTLCEAGVLVMRRVLNELLAAPDITLRVQVPNNHILS